MDTDDLEGIIIASYDDAYMYKKALRQLYNKFDTSQDDEENNNVILSERVQLIFHAVNQALLSFNEASDSRSIESKIVMPKRTKQQREKFAAANNVLTPAEQALANCRGVDPDLFFPERGASTREAKDVCRGCVIREGCLHIALITGEKFGIWGGMSERERRRLRKAGIVKELMVKYATTEEVQSDDEPDDDLEDLA